MLDSFDLSSIDQDRSKWVRLGLNDMEAQVKHSGPSDQERFRQKLVRAGIMKQVRDSISINNGRGDDFFRAYAEQFITDWRGVEMNGEANPKYDLDLMGKILGKSGTAFAAVREAIEDETDFFSGNDSGS